MTMNKYFAFTLPEAIITIGIIGIVAALITPQLISNYQKKVVPIRLKKMYNTLWSAITLAEIENGPTDNWTFEDGEQAREFYKTQIKSKMKCIEYKTSRKFNFPDNYCFMPDGGFMVLNNMRSYGLLEVIFYPLGDKNSISYVYGIPENKKRRAYFTCNIWLAPRKVAGGELPAKTEVLTMDLAASKRTREQLLNGPGPGNDPWQYCKSSGAASCFQLIKRDGWEIKPDYPW